MLIFPSEAANPGLSASLENGNVNHLPTNLVVGLLALLLSQLDQGLVGHSLHKAVSQHAQGASQRANVLAIGYALLDFRVGESGIWADGAIVHQGQTGE